MKISKIELKNYRNIEKLEIYPCDGVNVIYGENAQGKTNILESIFLFTGLKSFRGSKDSELIKFDSPFAKISADFYSGGRNQQSEIKIDGRRRVKLNGVDLKSPKEMLGKFHAALFSPDFLSLVQGGPEERRKFTDSAVCRIKPKNAVILSEYGRLLKQRNTILRDMNYPAPELLEVIDSKFSVLGEEIYQERIKFLKEFIPFLDNIYDGLSSGKEKTELEYIRKGQNGDNLTFAEILSSHKFADMSARTTTCGIHRDDINIKINGIPARQFGSQGQQRSCAVALKLAEAAIIKDMSGEEPVILLDDVMSELDENRQDYILNHIKDRQVFITCCDPASIKRLDTGKAFHISGGRIIN